MPENRLTLDGRHRTERAMSMQKRTLQSCALRMRNLGKNLDFCMEARFYSAQPLTDVETKRMP